MCFPGGIAASASKAGSRYSLMVASTYAEYCPTLKEKLGPQSRVADGVGSIMEIVINGRDLETVAEATQAAIRASVDTPGLVRITAGNVGTSGLPIGSIQCRGLLNPALAQRTG